MTASGKLIIFGTAATPARVVPGPATAPVPGFESRVDGGVLQVRTRVLPGISMS